MTTYSEAASRAAFEALKAEVAATFELPLLHQDGLIDYKMREEPAYMPFPCIMIREPFRQRLGPDQPFFDGMSEYIFWETKHDDKSLKAKVVGKLRIISSITTGHYYPNETMDSMTDAACCLDRLLRHLDSKEARYIEQPLSRQVRRHEGFSPEYREFIVVPSRVYPNYAQGETSAQIARRIHAVRGHLRRYTSGLTVYVRPHVRGTLGSGVQVKDYVVKEGGS